DGRAVMVPPAYSIADVVWTAFLARVEFAGLGAEIPKRPALVRYWRAMQERPSFSAADIWTKPHAFRLIGGVFGIARGGRGAGHQAWAPRVRAAPTGRGWGE